MQKSQVNFLRNLSLLSSTSLLFIAAPAYAQAVGTPPGGNRSPIDRGAGSPFVRSTFTPAHKPVIPGIANGIGLAKHGFALDLSSSTATIRLVPAFMRNHRTVNINVGGSLQSFSMGSTVTAAQFVALAQVLWHGNNQTLVLDPTGIATGGTFSFNRLISPRITGLVVPQNVTALDNFGIQPLIGMEFGDLINNGTIYGYSTNPRIHTGLIYAQNIFNNGVISTQIPLNVSSTLGKTLPNVGIVLAAVNNIVNTGQITSSGSLTLATAYGSIANAPAATIMSNTVMHLTPGNNGNVSNLGTIVSTSGNIYIASPVVATNINLVGTDGIITGLMQAPSGAIDIRMPYYPGYKTFSSANTTINGGEYDASGGFNIFGGTGSITGSFFAPILSTHSAGPVNITDNTTTGITLTGSTAGSFNLSTAGPTTLSSITTSAGPIDVAASTGLLQTLAGSSLTATNGQLVLQNLYTTNGSILIGFGTSMHTTGTGGPVEMVVGDIPTSPVAGTEPANVSASLLDNGQIFYGANGITANPPTNNLTAMGENIVFETNGAPATSITLGGFANIIADPSISTVALPHVSVPVVSINTANDSENNVGSQIVASSTLTALPVSANLSSLSTQIFDVPSAGTAGTISSLDTLNRSRERKASESKSQKMFADGSIEASLFGDMPSDLPSHYNPPTPLSGYISTDSRNTYSLSQGNSLFHPNEDMLVITPFGKVTIAARALALVMVSERSVSVFDLDDNSSHDVMIEVSGQKIPLKPGLHATLTASQDMEFASINPAWDVGYRKLQRVGLNDSHNLFSSEFSIPSLINSVKQLKQLCLNNQQAQAKRITNHMLKTAACTQAILSKNGRFQQFKPPA